MSTSNAVVVLRGGLPARDEVSPIEKKHVAELNAFAFRSLQACFEPENRLFCRRLSLNGLELQREGLSSQSTLVALLGLHALAEAGVDISFDLSDILAAVIEDPNWISAPQDFGLLLWASALCSPTCLRPIFRRLEPDFFDHRSMREWRTRDLAIVLAALAHTEIVAAGNRPELADVSVEIYHTLEERQSEIGLFSRLGRSRLPFSLWGERFGAFSDQALCIYSLTKFAEAFEVEEPLDAATACADAVCTMQGSLGQWWCLYDNKRGCVARAYPVLSEHQGGLAPMALLALAEATGRNFDEPVFRGLRWLLNAHEIAVVRADEIDGSLWESIDVRGSIAMVRNYMTSFIGIPQTITRDALVVCRETRPDVFGWLLYALGAFGVNLYASERAKVL